ncbi:hypothetical protein RM844_19410 [Streptomyces sp. DSM 44915]|uniref:WYL domain-containing protein n=1 Tax=Streptomyces chisholmiae TaxID=3075540 RepID=A0ABU2JTZ2_9ACTN|nr:hypothetical protein [Streptomyces sp. DSM 44915]MDT0268456.1 hypothetical protein [Streptomyces sp. DSM 44915]
MSDTPLSPDLHEAAAKRCAAVVAQLAEWLAGPPTLAEFLDVLGWAVPTGDAALADSVALPVGLRAHLGRGRRYRPAGASRVGELPDAAFTEATDLLALLAEGGAAGHGRPVTLAELTALLSAVRSSAAVAFADVPAEEPVRISLSAPPKRVPKPVVGDLLAIPAATGGHHLAVVLARDRFGTALGVFRGTFPLPRIGGPAPPPARPHPLYTDEQLIAAGVWRVVDHDASLCTPFPSEPEIYHRPDMLPPGTVRGEGGAAETAAGALRAVDRTEAEAVGLLDGSYRQVHPSGELQRVLDEGAS